MNVKIKLSKDFAKALENSDFSTLHLYEFTKLIDVESTSQDSIQDSIHLQNTLNMEEIYLFNRGV